MSNDNKGLALMAAANVAVFVLIGHYAPTVLAAFLLFGFGLLVVFCVLCSVVRTVRCFVRARRTTRLADVEIAEARMSRRLARQRAREASPIRGGGGWRRV